MKSNTQLTTILLLSLALCATTPTHAMLRSLSRLGLPSTNLYGPAPRVPLTRPLTRTLTRPLVSKATDLPHNQKPTTPVLEEVVRRLDAAGLIPANLDSRPALDALLAAGKADTPANQHQVEAQPLVIYYSPADLNKWAQELEQEAAGVEEGEPRSKSALQRYHAQKLIAAALRSEAEQIKQPGSPITESKLRETTPGTLEALALQLEQEKKALEKRAENPDSLSLADAERKAHLQMQIPALRNQAKILRKQVWKHFFSQDVPAC